MADEAAAGAPMLKTLSQFARSIHFTNDAAANNTSTRGAPKIGVKVNVVDEDIGSNRHVVTLDMAVEANTDDDAVFTVEIEFVGVFEITNVAADKLQTVLKVECPRLLFPFARRIIADATREGGFPPLILDPIDFYSLFVQQRRAASEEPPAEKPKLENGAD